MYRKFRFGRLHYLHFNLSAVLQFIPANNQCNITMLFKPIGTKHEDEVFHLS